MIIELQKKEKENEQLVRQIQGEKPSNQAKTNLVESFLVTQLKKQNRQLKLEIQTKDVEIDSLKRNVKLAKTREFESELAVYVEECQRLRTILEQTAI